MSEPRTFASLSSSLLARKGFAKPAMRPQSHLMPLGQDDLGWNDMGLAGFEDQPTQPASSYLTPLPMIDADDDFATDAPVPQVVRQQAEIAREFGDEPKVQPAPVTLVAPAPAATPAKKPVVRTAVRKVAAVPMAQARSKAAFTLRLDPERHLRLRLASAIGHRSAQKLLVDALDAYLETIPGLDAVAAGMSAAPAAGTPNA